MATTTRIQYDVRLDGNDELPDQLIIRRVERDYRPQGRGETQVDRRTEELLTLTRAQAGQLIAELAEALAYDPKNA